MAGLLGVGFLIWNLGDDDGPGSLTERLGVEATATPTPTPTLRSFTIAASGDFLSHGPVLDRALANGNGSYDFRPMLEHIRPIIEGADLGLCHQEIPISRDNSYIASYPVFNAPKELAQALRYTGYDACSTASNHSLDQGAEGLDATIDVLERAGLETEGTSNSPKRAERPTILDVEGVKVGWVSYTYGVNGVDPDSAEADLVNYIDVPEVLQAARKSKKAGAEFVVASLHWGQEFVTEPTEDQRQQARKLLRSPALDLILGHHVHVVQPIEKIGREYVVYGMGNILSNQRAGATPTCCPENSQDGIIAHVEVREKKPGRFVVRDLSYVPTWVEPGTFEVVPVKAALTTGATDAAIVPALEASLQRTLAAVNMFGAKKDGIRILKSTTGQGSG